jgi:hypothetical protein
MDLCVSGQALSVDNASKILRSLLEIVGFYTVAYGRYEKPNLKSAQAMFATSGIGASADIGLDSTKYASFSPIGSKIFVFAEGYEV